MEINLASRRILASLPLGVPPDLKSGVKNVLTFLCSADLQSAAIKNAINNKGCRGIINPPVLIGRTFFTADFKSAGTPSGFIA